MSMLDDIGAYLAAHSIGTVGTNLFLGDMPETPDICVALYEYAGEPPEAAHDSQVLEYPGLQVRVRGTSYSAVKTAIENIQSHLFPLANTTLSGSRYLYFRPVQSPFSMGRDSSKRVEMVQNYIVTKAR